jgi:hypothetical protein
MYELGSVLKDGGLQYIINLLSLSPYVSVFNKMHKSANIMMKSKYSEQLIFTSLILSDTTQTADRNTCCEEGHLFETILDITQILCSKETICKLDGEF